MWSWAVEVGRLRLVDLVAVVLFVIVVVGRDLLTGRGRAVLLGGRS